MEFAYSLKKRNKPTLPGNRLILLPNIFTSLDREADG